jgi:AraC-like DNA-binding protein/mannose-6-phosphate isomerase-like protein (cupin superfamily)
MRLDYEIKPVLVKKISYITHKGKKRDFKIIPHFHERAFHEMIFVDYGKIILNVNKNTSYIAPGECILIPGGAKHSFKGEAGAPFNFLNIMFYGEMPESLFGRSFHLNRKCLELIGKLKQESAHEQSYCREIMGCCLTELLFHVLRQTEFSVPNKLPESANIQRYQSELVNRALAIIAAEYSTPLNLKQLSRAAGIGESRLRQLLKIETGENFTAILQRQRISAAKHLLSEGSFSLENIANAVGYKSSSFFFKVFKRASGMTPRAYLLSLGEPAERE